MADYLESGARGHVAVSDATLAYMASLGLTLTDAALEALGRVHPEYLEEAFRAVDADHGGVDAYIGALGIDRDRLRSVMTV